MDGLTDCGGERFARAQVGARVLLASVSHPGRALGDNMLGVGAGQGQGQTGLEFKAEPSLLGLLLQELARRTGPRKSETPSRPAGLRHCHRLGHPITRSVGASSAWGNISPLTFMQIK